MLKIYLRPYQYDFIYSRSRYPSLVGGWATGKTLCAISRALIYTRLIPNNLGIIFRKTARSLADSTMKDFEKYSNQKVDSNRNFTYPNKSTIMFRHLDEIDSINQQNINLGWFYLEQGEELESEKEFMMLFGRLRRDVKPTEDFKKLELPTRSGWVIANAGDNWIKKLWKDQPEKDFSLTEATTWDNAQNLPQDFLDSLKVLEKKRPEMYRQYVLNDWSVDTDQYILIKPREVEALKNLIINEPRDKYIVAIDPAMGGDECVFYAFKNSKIIDSRILHERDTMKVAGEAMIFMARNNINDVVIDRIGIGQGITDRLRELGKNVIGVNVAESARNENKFANLKSEIWWYVMEQIQDKKVCHPGEDDLIKQLTAVRYKVVNSSGKIIMEHKSETKKRIESSPDRADAYVLGIWGLQHVEYVKKDSYGGRNRILKYEFNPATV